MTQPTRCWVAVAMLAGLGPGPAGVWADPAPQGTPGAMGPEEAIGVLAQFLRISADGMYVVREFNIVVPDTDFRAVVRHKAPSDSNWWGPVDGKGMVDCQLAIGRLRGTGQPYVRQALWGNLGAHAGGPREPVVALDDVPAYGREFLQAYCPYFDERLKLDHFQGFPLEGSTFGMTSWVYYTPTTALQIGADVRLDDGSIWYRCWYRTGLTPPALTEEQAREVAEEQWRPKWPERELVFNSAICPLESERSPTKGPVWFLLYRDGPDRETPEDEDPTLVQVLVDAVTGRLLFAPNYTPPKLRAEEARKVCDEQWLPKWPEVGIVEHSVGLFPYWEKSPSWGAAWHFEFRYESSEGLAAGDKRTLYASVYVDALTGELLEAPDELPGIAPARR